MNKHEGFYPIERAARFWSHIVRRSESECWPCDLVTNIAGYSSVFFRVDGKRFVQLTHRVVWYLSKGPIPADKQVCHSCDNPWCCNPSHLYLASNARNHADKKARGRGRTDRPGKLAPFVDEIRASPATVAALAFRYGASMQAIRNIRAFRAYP